MAMAETEVEYGDVHRAFLQAFMTKGVFRGKEVFQLLPEILKEYGCTFDPGNQDQLKAALTGMIKLINRQLRPMGMEIRRCFDERNETWVFVLINRVESAQTISAAKDFTTVELEYFKLILSVMFAEKSRSLKHMNCLNLTSRLSKKFSMEDGERFLERMISQKWLEKSGGEIRLHVRAIYDLEPYLKDTFGLGECPICKGVVMSEKNQKCSECGHQAHWFCVSKQRRPQCPNQECKAAWPMMGGQGHNNGAVAGGSCTSSSSTASQPEAAATAPKRVKMMRDSSSSGSEQDDE